MHYTYLEVLFLIHTYQFDNRGVPTATVFLQGDRQSLLPCIFHSPPTEPVNPKLGRSYIFVLPHMMETQLATRRAIFYVFLASLLCDVYASKAAVLDHLTIWSWCLHMLYFELHLPTYQGMAKALHGPSFTGAHALFSMYCWTMFANPNMEFDLAPEGRAAWLVYVRALVLHLFPVIFHWMDLSSNQVILAEIYESSAFLERNSMLFRFWVCLGGYFAMGLTWEQFNGDAAATYRVEIVPDETYVLVSKVIGVLSCIVAYSLALKPKLFKEKNS